ncbi:MAG: acyl dehydratase [Candidatus Nephthysia bennettiae]|uniref:MaoC family dehydratase n=1 Tax=Candidatus Nephthysia bennettiae TaxID=3127016 RepID=A0A934NER3_9BACT|nr:MaoC family dehydratase [Candidatus Dormibacteraeota bacterium]MBJ7613460.1 MaoC family dehydratase [Candidatus Dormibacteraeota bacterium]PZR91129.1 MAG: acyl dehydratase [Candidatus Dormibacteraeota bacterium]
MEEHRARLSEAFGALEPGKQFVYRRTFTDGDVALFCGVTGDINPYHQDDLFAASTPFGRRIIPGLLTASMLTHVGGMLGFLATEMQFEFVGAVYVGDTVTCTLTFVERDEQRRRFRAESTSVNQDGVEVLRGRVSGFPSQVRLK